MFDHVVAHITTAKEANGLFGKIGGEETSSCEANHF